MTTLPADMAFVLDQKRRYFWNLRAIAKTDSSYAAHGSIASLPWKRRQKEVRLHFDKYCNQVGRLIDDAVPLFVELVSRLEEMPFADRAAMVRSNVEDCIINPSITRSSIVRWLADVSEGHPSLEVLRALHEDPDTWVAPRWLTPLRTRVERKNGVWFFVSGSKRTRVSRQFAVQYRKRLNSLPANLPTTTVVNDLEIAIGAQLAGVFDRALAKCIEKLLPERSNGPQKGAKRPSYLPPTDNLSPVTGEPFIAPPLSKKDLFSPESQDPAAQSQETQRTAVTSPEPEEAGHSQVITRRTYFIMEGNALAHSQDKPGELIAAYPPKAHI